MYHFKTSLPYAQICILLLSRVHALYCQLSQWLGNNKILCTLVACPASRRSCAARLLSSSSRLSAGLLFAFQSTVRAQSACTCVKESALKATAKQQAAGTSIFTSMYVLHAYTASGLYMFNASIVFTDSKSASSNGQSCLWLEKTTFFDLVLHVGLACRFEPSVETQAGSSNRCGFEQREWQADKGVSDQHQSVHWHNSKDSARWALCQCQTCSCQWRGVFGSQGLGITATICSQFPRDDIIFLQGEA